MRYQGKITVWKDDRGFGFITPIGGGAPVFVHISAFRKNLRRPAGNELVTYELYKDPKKGYRAQDVMFFGTSQSFWKKGHRKWNPFIVILFMIGMGIYAWQYVSSNRAKISFYVGSALESENTSRFQCKGKRYCSEMTSCEEAIFYLKNCPGVQIDGDGDGDGIPCELNGVAADPIRCVSNREALLEFS